MTDTIAISLLVGFWAGWAFAIALDVWLEIFQDDEF